MNIPTARDNEILKELQKSHDEGQVSDGLFKIFGEIVDAESKNPKWKKMLNSQQMALVKAEATAHLMGQWNKFKMELSNKPNTFFRVTTNGIFTRFVHRVKIGPRLSHTKLIHKTFTGN